MDILVRPEAAAELAHLSLRERKAMVAAFEKLEALGEQLGFPHTSAVQGVDVTLRELRPRAGRSRHRALYRRVGPVLIIAAIAPEAGTDPRGFSRAVVQALERLDQHGG